MCCPQEGTELFATFEQIDLAFTVVFTVELMVNMTAHWLWAFWRDGWNQFDFIVVMVRGMVQGLGMGVWE